MIKTPLPIVPSSAATQDPRGPIGELLDLPARPYTPRSALATLPKPFDCDLRPAIPASPGVALRTPSAPRVQLRFDDGQVHILDVGAVIGRNPTKERIPRGFAAVTVRSKHVSRRHWTITVGDQVVVSDLGSQAGTILESPNGCLDIPASGLAVVHGDRVKFADRSAKIELR